MEVISNRKKGIFNFLKRGDIDWKNRYILDL
jgi:hypothetical protein